MIPLQELDVCQHCGKEGCSFKLKACYIEVSARIQNSQIQCIVEVFERVDVYCGIVGYSWQSHLLFNTVSYISAKMDYINV